MRGTAQTSPRSSHIAGRTLPVATAAALALCLAAPRATQAFTTTGGIPSAGIEWSVSPEGELEVRSSMGTTVVITCMDGVVQVNGQSVTLPDSLGGGLLLAQAVTRLTVRNTSPSGDAATTFDLSGVTADCFTALTADNIYARVDHEIEDTDDLVDSPISDPLGVAHACPAAMPVGVFVLFACLMATRRRRANS